VISEYWAAALRRAQYEILPDDGSYYGQIQGFDGVYANASTLEDCREEGLRQSRRSVLRRIRAWERLTDSSWPFVMIAT